MKIFAARLALGLLSLAFPLTASAAPDNVTGIDASLKDGKVTVTWDAVDGDISAYRVFYSHASILKENGLYDDFESVEGTRTSYAFTSLPPVDTLYVSVLAVDAQGEESPFFTEEASVTLRASASSENDVVALSAASTLRLLTAEKASATGVLLTFSEKVAPLGGDADDLFDIRFGSGSNLAVLKAEVSGTQVLLTTFPMTPGTVYLLQVTGDVRGVNADGDAVDMDPLQLPVFVQSAASSSSAAQASGHPDVTNLRLRAVAEGNKKYTVEASWNAPAAAGVDGFVITQSNDGGRTFGPSLKVSAASRGVTIPHVTGGAMGIAIRTAYADGQTSKGVFQSITLGAGQSAVSSAPVVLPPVGSVTGQNNSGGKLPESGVNIWVLLTLTGAAVAWKKVRMQRAGA